MQQSDGLMMTVVFKTIMYIGKRWIASAVLRSLSLPTFPTSVLFRYSRLSKMLLILTRCDIEEEVQ
jgi:hypothetical protein